LLVDNIAGNSVGRSSNGGWLLVIPVNLLSAMERSRFTRVSIPVVGHGDLKVIEGWGEFL